VFWLDYSGTGIPDSSHDIGRHLTAFPEAFATTFIEKQAGGFGGDVRDGVGDYIQFPLQVNAPQ